jgi:signal transduction histidine kinase
VVQKAVGLTTNLIKKSTQNFELDCNPILPRFIGNAQRIEQVVINLIVNACQSLAGPDRSVSVSTDFDFPKKQIVLTVADEGEGIDEKAMKQIFDPFFTTRREQGGTGLGLAISHRIVRDHGGTLHFSSTPGAGTTVHVIFPLTQSDDGKKDPSPTDSHKEKTENTP